MSIRRTIILLTVPLFLGLALINGALLYFQEKAEMSQALGEQALAAAVTSAEFISAMERPQEELARPLRAKALQAAARHVTGLDGIYLVMPGAESQALVPPSRPWSLDGLVQPGRAHSLPAQADATGHRYVVALAPTVGGAFVAARIDAEPMFARMDTIRYAIVLIVLVSGVIATVLALFVARRIVRELDENHRMIAAIAAGDAIPSDQEMTIREVRDLAGAVRLMEASSKAAAERSRRVTARRDRKRTVETALAANRDSEFAPVVRTLAGAQVAARICGDAPLGVFFALCAKSDRGMVVLGRCAGETPQQAFAQAVATRRYLESNGCATLAQECLAKAKAEHAIEELRFVEWTVTDPPSPSLLALTDEAAAARAAGYAERNRDVAPADLLDGIERLLEPSGVFAAVSR
jgi:HAMP domain-containing protein